MAVETMKEVVWSNSRRFELTIRENQGRYVAYVEVLDCEPSLQSKFKSSSFAGWSDGEVEQRARQWISGWKK